jgi:hypothetical protein
VKKIKIIVSSVAALIAILHIANPNIAIDTITISLFLIAIIPWFIPYLDTVELPCGIIIGLKDTDKVSKQVKEAGLVSDTPNDSNEFCFQQIASRDPNLALAGLKIEIEKKLVLMADSKLRGTGRIFTNLGSLTTTLARNNILTSKELEAINGLNDLLNRAVHGAEVHPDAADRALELGVTILKSLDEKIDNNK